MVDGNFMHFHYKQIIGLNPEQIDTYVNETFRLSFLNHCQSKENKVTESKALGKCIGTTANFAKQI